MGLPYGRGSDCHLGASSGNPIDGRPVGFWLETMEWGGGGGKEGDAPTVPASKKKMHV